MWTARAVMGLICLLAWSTVPAQPAALRQVALRDQQARPLRADALQGHVVLLHFIFTGCSATCPTQVRELVSVLDALPPPAREAVRFVSVSLDPHDTPATLAAFARLHGADRAGWQLRAAALATSTGSPNGFRPSIRRKPGRPSATTAPRSSSTTRAASWCSAMPACPSTARASNASSHSSRSIR
jgi:hypothetical protein